MGGIALVLEQLKGTGQEAIDFGEVPIMKMTGYVSHCPDDFLSPLPCLGSGPSEYLNDETVMTQLRKSQHPSRYSTRFVSPCYYAGVAAHASIVKKEKLRTGTVSKSVEVLDLLWRR